MEDEPVQTILEESECKNSSYYREKRWKYLKTLPAWDSPDHVDDK